MAYTRKMLYKIIFIPFSILNATTTLFVYNKILKNIKYSVGIHSYT